jgi:hypothetical protein
MAGPLADHRKDLDSGLKPGALKLMRLTVENVSAMGM